MDKSVLSVVKTPILQCWNAIAPDVYDFCEDDNEIAIEMCIDADRLVLVVDEPEAYQAVKDLIKENGYQSVLSFLSKNIQLL